MATFPPLVSFVAAEPPVTVTLPFSGAGKAIAQVSVAFSANDADVAGALHVFDVTPAGRDPVNWQLAPTAAPGPLLVHVSVQVTLCVGFAGLGTHTTELVVSAACSAKLFCVEPVDGTVIVMVLLEAVPDPVVLTAPNALGLPVVPVWVYALVYPAGCTSVIVQLAPAGTPLKL